MERSKKERETLDNKFSQRKLFIISAMVIFLKRLLNDHPWVSLFTVKGMLVPFIVNFFFKIDHVWMVIPFTGLLTGVATKSIIQLNKKRGMVNEGRNLLTWMEYNNEEVRFEKMIRQLTVDIEMFRMKRISHDEFKDILDKIAKVIRKN